MESSESPSTINPQQTPVRHHHLGDVALIQLHGGIFRFEKNGVLLLDAPNCLPHFGTFIWMFPKMVGFPPKWMVKIMENPIRMDDLGVPLFSETSIY